MSGPRHDPSQLVLKAYHRGDLQQAERLLAKMLHSVPNDFNALHLLGLVRAAKGAFGDAERLIARALQFGNSPEAFSNHGNVLSELGRHDEAIQRYRRALLIKPQYAEAQFNLGNALMKCGQVEEAARSFADAIRIRPDYREALQNIAQPLRELGRQNEAVVMLRRAVALDSGDSDVLIALGVALQEAGELGEARAAFERALAADPSATAAYYHWVRMAKVAASDDVIAGMEELSERADRLSPGARSMLGFALYKAYEDTGRTEEAFAQLLEANRLARASLRYDEEKSRVQFARLRRAFSAELIAAKAQMGSPSELPIFILGFPRSGTTLTEQILASHPLVQGTGEHSFLSELVSSPALNAEGLGFPESLSRAAPEALRGLGEAYVDRLQRAAPNAGHITDKLPLNFMFIGLIHLILPKARIIHVQRDPLDTCLSCFGQRFRADNVEFSYDLAELGRHYRAYLDLMDHWKRVLPDGAMLNVRYEDLVENLEAEARRIVAYCGLAWDERCLSFHETARTVQTASLAQVRQPLYRSSLQRWRRYERHLGPLVAALAPG